MCGPSDHLSGSSKKRLKVDKDIKCCRHLVDHSHCTLVEALHEIYLSALCIIETQSVYVSIVYTCVCFVCNGTQFYLRLDDVSMFTHIYQIATIII